MATAANGVNGAAVQEEVKEQAAHGGPGVTTAIEGQEIDFKKISIPDAFNVLKCGPEGLTTAGAEARLAEYGPNKLPESKRNPVLQYLGYMWNPLSWAMEAAAIIAIALLDFADFALILALLILNATISFVEESSADKAIKALTAALAPKAKVLRDGKLVTLDAANLVPGDIVVIRLGDVVPADIKLLGEDSGEHDQPLQVDQAALTGESLPVKKFSGDVAFSGSAIKQGERHALVYATGSNTFFGRAASLIGSTQNVSNIQKIMTRIGAVCLITIGVWVVIELAVQFGHYRHDCKAGIGGCPTLLNMLVIIVGGIPIAMPTVLSVTLALGAFKLAKEGAIVARMSAVEEMAGMSILCSDKTGTLTLNKLSVNRDDVFCVSGRPLMEVLKFTALSADLKSEEPIDVVCHESYPDNATVWNDYTLVKFVPFNPVDKFTMAIIRENATDKIFRVMKGAPQVVLKRALDKAQVETSVNDKITEFASRGFRSLGVALAEGQTGDSWEMLAVVPMFDPPRHDTKETIEKCIEKGISVKMVTGDQLLIGKETARQLGMGTNMYTTEVLMKAKEGKITIEGHSNIEELVEEADGFAEVFPEHKYEIVAMLQHRHHLVAMTGDGVNDAPALKKADVGIAVAGATDAARGAADIVLTEPGLSTIVSAIIGARKIFQRMTTYAKYTVAMTFRIAFTFGLLTTIYNWYFPTLLIVLLAVFNDGAMIALSKDRVVASSTPNVWTLPSIFITGIVYGLYLTFATWLLYFIATKTQFFSGSIKMYNLNDQYATLENWCLDTLSARGLNPNANACELNSDYTRGMEGIHGPGCQGAPDLLTQCRWEQYYVRNSITRSLIYNYVSISGQSLVFVVRGMRYSLISRAGLWTYVAFALAQLASTLISIFGFAGYAWPDQYVQPCQFCQLSTGGNVPFFHGKAPVANTEAGSTDSVIGCTYYVIVAWIWAILFYLGLDPLKWILAWILNEEGMRSRGRKRPPPPQAAPPTYPEKESLTLSHMVPATAANPLGRASMQAPTPDALRRASIVTLGPSGTVTPVPLKEGAPNVARSSVLDQLTRSSMVAGWPAGGRT